MEFPFDINYVLPYEITILNGDYRILNQGQTARILASEKLTSIIDAIGEASFKAQGLYGAVTTARKFRLSDHRLYIIKKASDNNNLGSIIGLLKVGTKHLYVYDSNSQVHERTPLCVLDFYVHESKQRLGYGKRLFDTMLEFEKCLAHELAIDRPSNKCLSFLHKHYHLAAPIHQVNNFVVYHAFFNRSPVTSNRKNSASKQRNNPTNYQHQELTSWLLPSEKQEHGPISEQNAMSRNQRMRTVSDENELFGNRRQSTVIRSPSVNEERKPVSSYTTSYGQHYNQTALLREPTKTNGTTQSATYMPRTYTQVLNENNPFPSLQRHNTNPMIPTYHHQSSLMNDYRRCADSASNPSKPEPPTSVYTFPSLIKPTNNWRQQQSTIDSSSSGWRLFGVNRLLN